MHSLKIICVAIIMITVHLQVTAEQTNYHIQPNRHLSVAKRDQGKVLSVNVMDKLHCVMECSRRRFCSMLVMNTAEMICNIYHFVLPDSTNSNTEHTDHHEMYVKKEFDSGLDLIHQWMFNNDWTDQVGKSTMFDPVNAEFVEDRFGKPNSAVYLNSGYAKLPPGVYIEGDFTLSVWVKMTEVTQYGRLLLIKDSGGTMFFSICFRGTTVIMTKKIKTKEPLSHEFTS